jgi:hypothetical protein
MMGLQEVSYPGIDALETQELHAVLRRTTSLANTREKEPTLSSATFSS